MRFGIAIPQFVRGAGFDPSAMRRFLIRAEELPFDSAWTQEQVLGTMPNLAPIETLAFASAHTERLRLGCAVFVSPLHSPVHLAKSLSTLDHLTGGRLDVGVGIGGRRMFPAFGVDPNTLVSRFTEGVALLRALWSDREVNFDGRFWQLHGAAMEPKPVQRPWPPIWFGGSSPAAVRRAARLADGFFGAGSQTTAQFAGQVEVLRSALRDTGRDPDAFPVAKRVYIAVDDDSERGRATIAAALGQLYSFFGVPDLTPVAVYGPPDACADGLRAVADAGAELILCNPLTDEAEQLERLASDVLPRLS